MRRILIALVLLALVIPTASFAAEPMSTWGPIKSDAALKQHLVSDYSLVLQFFDKIGREKLAMPFLMRLATGITVEKTTLKKGTKMHLYCRNAKTGKMELEKGSNTKEALHVWMVPLGNTVKNDAFLAGRQRAGVIQESGNLFLLLPDKKASAKSSQIQKVQVTNWNMNMAAWLIIGVLGGMVIALLVVVTILIIRRRP